MAARRPELGKWLLWIWFYRDPMIRPYLPETRRYTKANTLALLHRHRSVYLKPVAGSGGRGVMRLSHTHVDYTLHFETRTPQKFVTIDNAIAEAERLMGVKTYVVQQDVRLARMNGRAFDIRVMMQKDARGLWQCTGMCAKVAGPRSAVTNVIRSRGTVCTVPDALAQSLRLPHERILRTLRELEQLGFAVCKRFEAYQTYAEIGLDVGTSRDGRLWLLEENTAPSHALFKHLSDRRAYARIQKIWFERARSRRRRPAGLDRLRL